MSKGDIQYYEPSTIQQNSAKKANVAAGATAINAGEPVAMSLGATSVTVLATSKPVVGTDYMIGISTSASTNTASAVGTVDYMPLQPGVVYLISPTVAATWNTQTKYNDLVGKRMVLDLTTGVYTILATDSANNGCVVMPLDIARYPGKVAFTIRAGAYVYA